jgi:hypothetical protein
VSVRNPQTPEEWARRKAHYAKSYAKRKRLVALRNRRGSHCQFRKGRFGVCGAALVESVDRLGRVIVSCPSCERRVAGICKCCPRKVAGRAGWSLYCAGCKRRAAADHNRKWVQNNRARKNASVRAYRRRKAA